MQSSGGMPIVVRIRDDVTGALSVVSLDEVSVVLDVWFPHVTAEATVTVRALRERLEAEDWPAVDRLAAALGLRVERFDAPPPLPRQRLSAEDWPGPR